MFNKLFYIACLNWYSQQSNYCFMEKKIEAVNGSVTKIHYTANKGCNQASGFLFQVDS